MSEGLRAAASRADATTPRRPDAGSGGRPALEVGAGSVQRAAGDDRGPHEGGDDADGDDPHPVLGRGLVETGSEDEPQNEPDRGHRDGDDVRQDDEPVGTRALALPVRGRSVRRRARPRVHRLMGAVMKGASGIPSPHPRQPALHRRIPDAMLQWCVCSARAKRRSPSQARGQAEIDRLKLLSVEELAVIRAARGWDPRRSWPRDATCGPSSCVSICSGTAPGSGRPCRCSSWPASVERSTRLEDAGLCLLDF